MLRKKKTIIIALVSIFVVLAIIGTVFYFSPEKVSTEYSLRQVTKVRITDDETYVYFAGSLLPMRIPGRRGFQVGRTYVMELEKHTKMGITINQEFHFYER